MAPTISEQRYGPTTGTGTGWIGVGMCASLAIGLPFSDHGSMTIRVALGAAVVGLVIWCFMLRPRVVVRLPDSLELRNAFSAWLVPLAAIEMVAVRAVTWVEVAGRKYDGIAVGRRIKAMVRGITPRRGDGFADAGRALGDPPRHDTKHPVANTPETIADLMTEQILAASARAKETGQLAGPVRRVWAVPELVLLGALLVAFVVAVIA